MEDTSLEEIKNYPIPPAIKTCLHLECKCRDEDLEFMSDELKKDPSSIYGGENHCPPLLHAVIKEHSRCVKFLLEHGALVNEEYTRLGETPLSLAVTRSTNDFVNLLLSHDATAVNTISSLTKELPIVRAVKHGNIAIVQSLLNHGARPDSCVTRNEEEIPIVFLALELGHEDIVKLLLESGANLRFHQHFDKHNLLFKHLQFALAEGQINSLKSLLLYGALHEMNKLTIYPNLRSNVHYSFPLLCVLFQSNNPVDINIKTIDMLYDFGFNYWKCDKFDKNVWHKFEKLEGNDFSKLLIYKIKRTRSRPQSLAKLCRIKIHNMIERNYTDVVDQLEIPLTLQWFLKFEY